MNPGPSTTGIADVEIDPANSTSELVVFVNETPCSDGPLRLSMSAEDHEAFGCPGRLKLRVEVACRECGCTDTEACFGGCSWVEAGLCSECQS